MGQVARVDKELSPLQRVGGFYETLEALELVAELLNFDVEVPIDPPQGLFFMVPAGPRESRYCFCKEHCVCGSLKQRGLEPGS